MLCLQLNVCLKCLINVFLETCLKNLHVRFLSQDAFVSLSNQLPFKQSTRRWHSDVDLAENDPTSHCRSVHVDFKGSWDERQSDQSEGKVMLNRARGAPQGLPLSQTWETVNTEPRWAAQQSLPSKTPRHLNKFNRVLLPRTVTWCSGMSWKITLTSPRPARPP